MRLTGKDPWGYQFAQPLWLYEPGISDKLRRDPFKNKERERLNRLLWREFELDAKVLDQGCSERVIPWGLFRHEQRSRRRLFAESLRAACHKAPGGLLGIAQVRHLAHQAGLLHSLRATTTAAAFPLELTLEDTVLGDPFTAAYTLQLDRVFYAIHPEPQKNRFAAPLLVVDATRVFSGGLGEGCARTPDKKLVLTLASAAPLTDKPVFKLRLDLGGETLTFLERTGREPGGSAGELVEVEACSKRGSLGYDFVVRSDLPGERGPWLGLAVLLADLWTQRSSGALARALKDAATPDPEPT